MNSKRGHRTFYDDELLAKLFERHLSSNLRQHSTCFQNRRPRIIFMYPARFSSRGWSDLFLKGFFINVGAAAIYISHKSVSVSKLFDNPAAETLKLSIFRLIDVIPGPPTQKSLSVEALELSVFPDDERV